jgi:hypothetical protein
MICNIDSCLSTDKQLGRPTPNMGFNEYFTLNFGI